MRAEQKKSANSFTHSDKGIRAIHLIKFRFFRRRSRISYWKSHDKSILSGGFFEWRCHYFFDEIRNYMFWITMKVYSWVFRIPYLIFSLSLNQSNLKRFLKTFFFFIHQCFFRNIEKNRKFDVSITIFVNKGIFKTTFNENIYLRLLMFIESSLQYHQQSTIESY